MVSQMRKLTQKSQGMPRLGFESRAMHLCECSHKDREGGGQEEEAGRSLPWSSPPQAIISVLWLGVSSSFPAKAQA